MVGGLYDSLAGVLHRRGRVVGDPTTSPASMTSLVVAARLHPGWPVADVI